MADEEKKEEKKIIVDDDWKQQAQKEKEALETQEEAEKEQAVKQEGQRESLPPGDFAALISMLTTQALFALGLIKVDGQDERAPDLAVAKYSVDMLATLQEKTKGNLTEEEEKVLESTLGQVRMAYVKVAG